MNIFPSMANMCLVAALSVLVFACITTQLFSGTMKNRCVLVNSVTNLTDFSNETYQTDGKHLKICQISNDIQEEYNSLPIKRHPTKDPCQEAYACLKRVNPGDGQVHFDNVIVSSLLIFEMFTLDGWVDTMHLVRRAHGSIYYDPLFVGIVYIGAFFIINLITAVMFNYYAMTKD